MKLLTFETDNAASYGAVVDGGIVDLGRAFDGKYRDLRHLIGESSLGEILERADSQRPQIGLEDIRFLPPITAPEKIICIGVNYANRNEEYRDASSLPKYPSVFMRAPGSLTGHRQPIVRPPESIQFDYEGEIAIIIGKSGRRIVQENAEAHIAGLTCMNEGTIRDWLRHGKFNVTPGKNFERSGAIGPWIVTADEFPNFDSLEVATRVNAEPRQHDTTANLMFPFRYLISYLSTFTELKPGDVIATGTPAGAGARFDPPRYLRAGDTVEVEVPGVGVLSNTVIDENV